MSGFQQRRPRVSRPPSESHDIHDVASLQSDSKGEDAVIELSRPGTRDQATRRCWICFEEESESEILEKGAGNDWRHPCKCSLSAHEECLLTWVDESQKGTTQGVNSSKTIRCPQCKEPYMITSKNSFGVGLMTFTDGWITRGLLATIPLGLVKAIGITCFHYGQGVMLDVLGQARLTDIILSLKHGDELRYIIGAGCIPFALIGARFDIFNFVLPLIPSLVCFSDTSFIQSRRPLDSSPALWICVLPWARNFYCFSWRIFLSQIEARWKAEAGLMKPGIRELAPGIGVREVQVHEIQHAQDDIPNDGGQNEGAGQAQDQEDDAIAERWIFVEAPRLARLVAGALLFPSIAKFAGTFLDKFSFFRKRFPHRFQKVIIGGVSFVLLKDMLNLLYLYTRAKGRSTRHIRNSKYALSSH